MIKKLIRNLCFWALDDFIYHVNQSLSFRKEDRDYIHRIEQIEYLIKGLTTKVNEQDDKIFNLRTHVNQIQELTKMPLEWRLAQAKRAQDINTKFLNEIWDEVNETQIKKP